MTHPTSDTLHAVWLTRLYFDPTQPRDEQGRWAHLTGGSHLGRAAVRGKALSVHHAAQAEQAFAAGDRVGGQRHAATAMAGMLQHHINLRAVNPDWKHGVDHDGIKARLDQMGKVVTALRIQAHHAKKAGNFLAAQERDAAHAHYKGIHKALSAALAGGHGLHVVHHFGEAMDAPGGTGPVPAPPAKIPAKAAAPAPAAPADALPVPTPTAAPAAPAAPAPATPATGTFTYPAHTQAAKALTASGATQAGQRAIIDAHRHLGYAHAHALGKNALAARASLRAANKALSAADAGGDADFAAGLAHAQASAKHLGATLPALSAPDARYDHAETLLDRAADAQKAGSTEEAGHLRALAHAHKELGHAYGKLDGGKPGEALGHLGAAQKYLLNAAPATAPADHADASAHIQAIQGKLGTADPHTHHELRAKELREQAHALKFPGTGQYPSKADTQRAHTLESLASAHAELASTHRALSKGERLQAGAYHRYARSSLTGYTTKPEALAAHPDLQAEHQLLTAQHQALAPQLRASSKTGQDHLERAEAHYERATMMSNSDAPGVWMGAANAERLAHAHELLSHAYDAHAAGDAARAAGLAHEVAQHITKYNLGADAHAAPIHAAVSELTAGHSGPIEAPQVAASVPASVTAKPTPGASGASASTQTLTLAAPHPAAQLHLARAQDLKDHANELKNGPSWPQAAPLDALARTHEALGVAHQAFADGNDGQGRAALGAAQKHIAGVSDTHGKYGEAHDALRDALHEHGVAPAQLQAQAPSAIQDHMAALKELAKPLTATFPTPEATAKAREQVKTLVSAHNALLRAHVAAASGDYVHARASRDLAAMHLDSLRTGVPHGTHAHRDSAFHSLQALKYA